MFCMFSHEMGKMLETEKRAQAILEQRVDDITHQLQAERAAHAETISKINAQAPFLALLSGHIRGLKSGSQQSLDELVKISQFL